jgi:hypothetical protein
MVREYAKGYLQQGLGEPVGAHGQANGQRGCPRQVAGEQGKDRQHQKEPQHTQGKNARQTKGSASFLLIQGWI